MTMRRTLGVRELKSHASAILREVESDGAAFVITVRGRPVARIEAFQPEPRNAVVDGMGSMRDSLKDLSAMDWEDFVALKRVWDSEDLGDD